MSRYFVSQTERFRIARLVRETRSLQMSYLRPPFFELKERDDRGLVTNITTRDYFDVVKGYAPLFFGVNDETKNDVDPQKVMSFFDDIADKHVARLERILGPEMTAENREIMARKFEALAQEITVESVEDQGYVCMWGVTSSLDPRKEHLKYVGMTWDVGTSPSFSGGLMPGEDFGCKCQILVVKKENARSFRAVENEGAVEAKARVVGG